MPLPVMLLLSKPINGFASAVKRIITTVIFGNYVGNGQSQKAEIQRQLLCDEFHFEPVREFINNGKRIEYWCARDALVLKAMSLVLTAELLPTLPKSCSHVAGNGGSKGALRGLRRAMHQHEFVFRSDVKGYYAHIQHERLINQLRARFPTQTLLLSLLRRHLTRVMITHRGEYLSCECGIGLGSPLSPLLGALYLESMDREMEQLMISTGIYYVRFMDDWVVLSPRRWKLKKAIARINHHLSEHGMQQHPDKTFIGRLVRGFSFLGFTLNHQGLTGIAPPTLQRYRHKLRQLYEQKRPLQIVERTVGQYQTGFTRWALSGHGLTAPPCLTSLANSGFLITT